VQEEEWQLCASKKEIPEIHNLSFNIPEVWAEDKTTLPPQTGLEHTPQCGRIKTVSYLC
jgi:hypothetical protein